MYKPICLTITILLLTGCKNTVIEKNKHNYNEIKDAIIEWDNIFSQSENDYLVYFYSERCGYCNEIKSDIISYYLKGKDAMYFVCTDIYAVFGPQSDLLGVNSINDFYIFGTPFLVRIFNYKVANYCVGVRAILEYLDI